MQQRMIFDIGDLAERFNAKYGEAEGGRRYRVVMPGIIADFNRMAQELKAGQRVKELYRMEDGTASVEMRAEALSDGKVRVTAEFC